jgi:hypothetical protein
MLHHEHRICPVFAQGFYPLPDSRGADQERMHLVTAGSIRGLAGSRHRLKRHLPKPARARFGKSQERSH